MVVSKIVVELTVTDITVSI